MTLPSASMLTHWEDFEPGRTYGLDTFVLDGAAAAGFDAVFSRPGAAESGCVSGMYLTGRLMRAITDSYLVRAAGLGAGGIPELDWALDVRPGASLSAIMTCVEKRALRSRPGVGLNVLTNAVVDETGRQVISWRANQFMRMRNPEAHATAAQQPAATTTAPRKDKTSEPAGSSGHPNVVAIGAHTFDEPQILNFAKRFDPQAFHLDDKAARNSLFGALCASGWHTCSVWHRLLLDHFDREARFAAFGNTSAPVETRRIAGLRNLRWLRPVFVGETITYAIENRDDAPATGAAPMVSCTGINDDGALVFSLDAVLA